MYQSMFRWELGTPKTHLNNHIFPLYHFTSFLSTLSDEMSKLGGFKYKKLLILTKGLCSKNY